MAALKKSDEAKYKAVCQGIRQDGAFIEAGENDNLIVQKLAANPNTLGFFGYSFLEENPGKLKGISINGVAPTYETISSFKYPGARPLYIYIKNAHAKAIPAVRAFAAEFTKESAFGPNGYLRRAGLIVRAEADPRAQPAGGPRPGADEPRSAQVARRTDMAPRPSQAGPRRTIPIRGEGLYNEIEVRCRAPRRRRSA